MFPELFIPGYPVGMNFGFSVGKRTEPGRKDWKRYYDASVVTGGDEFRRLAEAAKKRAVSRSPKIQAAYGFSTERGDVDYNAVAWSRMWEEK